MAGSNFDFLRGVCSSTHRAAVRAEGFALADPRASGFYARFALELAAGRFIRDRKLARWRRPRSLEKCVDRIVQRLKDAPEKDLQTVRREGNSAVHHIEPPFTTQRAVETSAVLHRTVRWMGGVAGWPAPRAAFDRSLLREIPGHIPTSAEEAQRLQAELDALRARHATLRQGNQDLETQVLEQLERVGTLESQLRNARAEIARLEGEVAALRTELDGTVPRADLDAVRDQLEALQATLEAREAAYRQLLAGAGLTSTRAFYRRGVLDFENLLTIAGATDRPDERDEAAAVVLEHLAGRLDAHFHPRPHE